jgi:hypothetical protein
MDLVLCFQTSTKRTGYQIKREKKRLVIELPLLTTHNHNKILRTYVITAKYYCDITNTNEINYEI